MKHWSRLGLGLIILGLAFILTATISTILPGAAPTMGATRYSVLVLGFIFALIGVDLLRSSNGPDWAYLMCLAGILLYYGTFYFTASRDVLVQEIVLPRLFAVCLLVGGVFFIVKPRLETFQLEFILASYKFLSSNWGILAIMASIIISVFSDVFRAAVLAYSVFWGTGIGVAMWMFSSKTRQSTALAFAPIIGFSLVAVIGSWLVSLDHPVQEWTWIFTLFMLVVNLGLLVLWRARHIDQWNELRWRYLIHEAGFGYAAALVLIVPVAWGGLRFSVFRGNAFDAGNYLSMAVFLARIPYSRFHDLNFLFQNNPALFWASSYLQTRWSTSMMMAYSALLVNLPLYRFDFAFSALPFALAFAPVYVRMRDSVIGRQWAFLLSAGIALGAYAQVVLDSRAVSLCTALPVIIALVLVLDRIWDDKGVHFLNWPVHPGEAILLVLLATTLLVLYVEILAFLIPGLALFGLYAALRRNPPIKKVASLFATGITAVLLIYASLPLYVRFFMSQVLFSQGLFVSWQNDYFRWLYHDFPAGVLGLNPYQLAPVASLLLHFLAVILLLLLAGTLPLLLFGTKKLENIFHLSGLLVLGGSLVFAFLYFQGQLWQAGKIFTYGYPFLMISLCAIPFILDGMRQMKVVSVVARALIMLWLVSQAGLGLYRLAVVSYGFEYPFHVQVQGTEHTTQTYPKLYAWNISGFLSLVSKEPKPLVWLSTNSVYQDMYWAFAMPSNAEAYAVNPFVGGGTDTTDLTLANITKKAPDYLLISNQIWDLNPGTAQIQPVIRDSEFALISLQHPLPRIPLLIGIRTEPFTTLGTQVTSFFLQDRAWIEFLSPTTCQGKLTAKTPLNPKQNPEVRILIIAKPAGSESLISIGQSEELEIPFSLRAGYNLVTIQFPTQVPGTDPTRMLSVEFPASKISFSRCLP
jgi:hypothetical protein